MYQNDVLIPARNFVIDARIVDARGTRSSLIRNPTWIFSRKNKNRPRQRRQRRHGEASASPGTGGSRRRDMLAPQGVLEDRCRDRQWIRERKIVAIPADLTNDADARPSARRAMRVGRWSTSGQQCRLVARRASSRTSTEARLGAVAAVEVQGYVRCLALRAADSWSSRAAPTWVEPLRQGTAVKASNWGDPAGARQCAGQKHHDVAGRASATRPRFWRGPSRPVAPSAGTASSRDVRDMKISFARRMRLTPSSIPIGRIAEVEEVAALVTCGVPRHCTWQRHPDRDSTAARKKALMDRSGTQVRPSPSTT